MADLIERQAAIDAIDEEPAVWDEKDEYEQGLNSQWHHDIDAIKSLPSAQPELPIKQKCTICPHCDNCDVNDDGTISQPEPHWIPCSEPPKESGTYIVTAYDGIDKRVTFVKYQKTLKRWDLTGARAYWRILAYKPLPEPWRGEE